LGDTRFSILGTEGPTTGFKVKSENFALSIAILYVHEAIGGIIFRATSERSSGETSGLVENPYSLNSLRKLFQWPTEIRDEGNFEGKMYDKDFSA
jgi:hypothetical protein